MGLYGGTFDPVHFGHLKTADEVQQALDLGEVRMVLSANPPHKQQLLLSAKDRFNLLSLAVKKFPALQADDCEIKRSGPSYMIDTLRYYRQREPDKPLLLILGMEAFNGLMSWYQWGEIIRLAHIVVTDRAGFGNELAEGMQKYVSPFLTTDKSELKRLTHGKIYQLPVTQIDISATQVRQRIKSKQTVKEMLPTECWDSIFKHGFYTQGA
ncbi:MAG: nicotinate-nucleotide adenylyltransferase [Cycloclasticus sp.]|nr:nicotinate-nucleotide adenylyltransferase [Cycloclasticus sp.]